MATIAPSQYTRYNLHPAEELEGQIINLNQRYVLQTQLADTVQLKLNLVPDVDNFTKFIQQEAFYAGQIALLDAILSRSDQAEMELRNLIETTQGN